MIEIGDIIEIGHISQEFVEGQLARAPSHEHDTWGIENRQYEYIVYPTGLVIIKEKNES
jgi:hypothetical protein